jgi:hypothetical protein
MAHLARTPPWKGKPFRVRKSLLALSDGDPSRFSFELASSGYQQLVELLVLNTAGDQLPSFWYVERDKTVTATFFPREDLTSENEYLGVCGGVRDVIRGAHRAFGCLPLWGKSPHAPLGEAPDAYRAIISDRHGRSERLELSLRPFTWSDRLEMVEWRTLQAFFDFSGTEPAASTARGSCLERWSTT